jgi:hypothetical protein
MMPLKCQCPNCGYLHITEHARKQVEVLKQDQDQKEDDGTETVG